MYTLYLTLREGELTFAARATPTYRGLADVSANVASRGLNELVAAGVLQREGAKRGAWYRPAEEWIPPIRAISREAGGVAQVRPPRAGRASRVIPPRFSDEELEELMARVRREGLDCSAAIRAAVREWHMRNWRAIRT